MTTLLWSSGIAFLLSLILTPLVGSLARALNIVDRPDRHRKLHTSATPLGGGFAVLLAFMAAVGITLLIPSRWQSGLHNDISFLVSLGVAAVFLCGIGLIDDRYNMRGRQKLLGQTLAVGILMMSGLVIERVSILGWNVELGLLALPFTLFWVLGAINALNLIDGIDGLASTVGIILSIALASMAFLTGQTSDAVVAVAIAGALGGFLCHNFPPAKIFLGDAGSMLIGLVLGAMAIRCSLKGPATVALAAPTAIWAIPIFDVSMAIVRRKLTGRSIYTTDRGHLHHCLLRKGYSGKKTLAWIGALCALTATGALISVYRKNEYLALASIVAVVGTSVVTRFFGHAEFVLLYKRLRHFVSALASPNNHEPDLRSRQLCTRLQGTRQWEELWDGLTGFADRFQLSSIQLNINFPAIHEEYHATWERTGKSDAAQLWHTDFPLVSSDLVIGRLKIAGPRSNGSFCTWMEELSTGLKPFEEMILSILDVQAPEPVGAAATVASSAPVLQLDDATPARKDPASLALQAQR